MNFNRAITILTLLETYILVNLLVKTYTVLEIQKFFPVGYDQEPNTSDFFLRDFH